MLKRGLPLIVILAITVLCSSAAETVQREAISYGAQFEMRTACSCDGVKKKGIFAHPPWQGAKGRVLGQFDIHLNDVKEPVLTFFMGIQDGHGSDQGVIYRVKAGEKELWSEVWKDAKWRAVRIDLKEYAGKAVSLELAVDSLGEHYANWGEPRITEGEKVLYDLAEMVDGAGKYIERMDSIPASEMPASVNAKREWETREASKSCRLPSNWRGRSWSLSPSPISA